jgi:hypothetical protein
MKRQRQVLYVSLGQRPIHTELHGQALRDFARRQRTRHFARQSLVQRLHHHRHWQGSDHTCSRTREHIVHDILRPNGKIRR